MSHVTDTSGTLSKSSRCDSAYAQLHDLSIVPYLPREGQAGLDQDRRGLVQLSMMFGRNPISPILVYDVSRWGRFQDPTKPRLRIICKQAGIKVAYCAEQFDNDGSIRVRGIVKEHQESNGAAEFSRELSAKSCGPTSPGCLGSGRAGLGIRPSPGIDRRKRNFQRV